VNAAPPTPDALRQQVRSRYAAAASGSGSCCGSEGGNCGDSCCGASGSPEGVALELGYSVEDLASLPPGSNLGLGCGNPSALLSLAAGETVLDLGSGGGIDCFIAARRVGPNGRVIGVDMTPEMVARARSEALRAGSTNVEFRLGEIEHLPVADGAVDVVISNCVINLVPDKAQVYREAFRVLRPGGRLAISDVVALHPVSEEMRGDPEQWASCSSGALVREEVEALLRSSGFADVSVEVPESPRVPDSLKVLDGAGIVPGSIRATKPRTP
jgi:arsenite methyltransferase